MVAVMTLVIGRSGSCCFNTPAITVPQMRQVFTRLLRHPAPSPGEIAEEVTRVLRRNEESRIYHWYARTQTYPPKRSQMDSS